MSEEDYQYLLLSINPEVAKLKKEHFISYLFTHKQDDDFYKLLQKQVRKTVLLEQ